MATRKMKRYAGDDGSYVEAGSGPSMTDDEDVKSLQDKGQAELERMRDSAAAAKPASKSAAKSTAKPASKSTQYGASERNIGSSLRFGKDRSTHPEYPEDYKKPAKPDVTKMSLSERSKMSRENARSGGTKTDTRSVSERLRSAFGMKSGGMTASKRADGIASKGKTRGKMC
jgi:hypothetical protein